MLCASLQPCIGILQLIIRLIQLINLHWRCGIKLVKPATQAAFKLQVVGPKANIVTELKA